MPNGCAGTQEFWVLWSPFEQLLSRTTFESAKSAESAAVEKAKRNPGVDYYVMHACKFVRHDDVSQSIVDTTPRT